MFHFLSLIIPQGTTEERFNEKNFLQDRTSGKSVSFFQKNLKVGPKYYSMCIWEMSLCKYFCENQIIFFIDQDGLTIGARSTNIDVTWEPQSIQTN